MRTFVSALLGLLALVVASGGLVSAWLDENLVEESGFIALAAPLGDDADFQAALAESLAQEVTANTELPEQFDSFVEPLIRDAAGAVTRSSGYPAAWAETLRLSHAVTFTRAPDPSESAPAVLTLDLGPVVGLVADSVGAGLGVDIRIPEDTTVEVGTLERGGLLHGIADAVQDWRLYLAGAAVLALLALVIARRRGTTLALLGLGVVGIGVLGILAGDWVPDAATRAPGTGAVADVFIRGLAERAGADIADSSVPVVVGGLVAVLVGVVGQLAFGRGRRA
ncbi:hypothetical protein [Arthrobacter sedimenti]|uniref:hypothetical protein n=1 Tax=Arthrobacter sedimenti TaxID=2694931 RepID=UPI000B34AB31|nr:hypothetical protein [Arthrobacter sedimenti]OUM39917.1 hypothetical protein B8W73_15965 [Arthrobacter agilis]